MVSGMDHTCQSLWSKRTNKDIRLPSQYPSLFARQTPWCLPHSHHLVSPRRTGQRIRPIFSDVVSQSLELQFSPELPEFPRIRVSDADTPDSTQINANSPSRTKPSRPQQADHSVK